MHKVYHQQKSENDTLNMRRCLFSNDDADEMASDGADIPQYSAHTFSHPLLQESYISESVEQSVSGSHANAGTLTSILEIKMQPFTFVCIFHQGRWRHRYARLQSIFHSSLSGRGNDCFTFCFSFLADSLMLVY